MRISCPEQEWRWTERRQRPRTAAMWSIAILLFVSAAVSAPAQTYKVLHAFSGTDGASPQVGVTLDRAGRLYGVARYGGNHGKGVVFQLVHEGTGWVQKPLYEFYGMNDGAAPDARAIFGPDGDLYGTAASGGVYGAGVVYKLQPPAASCKTAICPWIETVLYAFTGQADGGSPSGDLVFDHSGNIYGTTRAGALGGQNGCLLLFIGCGTVYELTPAQGSWNLTVLYAFNGTPDAGAPGDGVTFDAAGNLYGTAQTGGSHNLGAVFKLTPNGSGWSETIVHDFGAGHDGAIPEGGLAFDPAGNLYGVTASGGSSNHGTAFALLAANGGWDYSVIYNMVEHSQSPVPMLTLDSAGNLYGTTESGGAQFYGSVFKLVNSGGTWTYTSLHDFTYSDGAYPLANVVFDAQGNLYGTTNYGGAGQNGVVFEITP